MTPNKSNLLCIGQEGSAVHRAVEEHRRGHTIQSQAGCESCGLPMAVRNSRHASFATFGPPAQPCHLGGSRGLINEDQPLGIEIKLTVEPGPAAAQDIGALLF